MRVSIKQKRSVSSTATVCGGLEKRTWKSRGKVLLGGALCVLSAIVSVSQTRHCNILDHLNCFNTITLLHVVEL
jgi:hypothetical protein